MEPTTIHLVNEFAYKYDYLQTKDLLKIFLTLISGTLVVSISFADKIVDIRTVSQKSVQLIIVAWSLFISSLVLCGLAMCLIAAFGGCAIYGDIPVLDCGGYLALLSWSCILASGASYVGGFIFLVLSTHEKFKARGPKLPE